jgi:hypothetical protein
MMMQPTSLGDFPDWANLWLLDRLRHGTIHGQRPVCAPVMVIADVCRQEPLQMSLMQDHHVIQALATDAPDEPLDRRVLPRTPGALSTSSMPRCCPRCRNDVP